jgi:hypothetical protein
VSTSPVAIVALVNGAGNSFLPHPVICSFCMYLLARASERIFQEIRIWVLWSAGPRWLLPLEPTSWGLHRTDVLCSSSLMVRFGHQWVLSAPGLSVKSDLVHSNSFFPKVILLSPRKRMCLSVISHSTGGRADAQGEA